MTALARGLPKTRRWTVDEYYRLADYGFFRGERVELVGGKIIQMAPQRDAHAAAVLLGRDALSAAFGPGHVVRPQLPLRFSPTSEPEPDLAVVAGSPRDFVGKGHPTSALLVVEVSDTTLAYDRRRKAGMYAKAGIADYWVLNLVDRQVEVHRDPVQDRKHPFGHRYATVTFHASGDAVTPLARPGGNVRVLDLLP